VPQVDFYILRGSAEPARLRFACRLIEKVWLGGHRVLAWVDSEAEAGQLDTLLWTFAERAFVPHDRLAADGTAEAPVALQAGELPATPHFDVLVNLGSRPAPADGAFARVAEVIDADETRRAQGRERFRAYRDRGWTPNTLNIDNETDAGNG
jgi:DNA polymerase-3 subunit chi